MDGECLPRHGVRFCSLPNPVPLSGPHTPNETSCAGEDGSDPDSMELGIEVRACIGGVDTSKAEQRESSGLQSGEAGAVHSPQASPRGWGAPHSCCSLPRLPY